MNFRDAEWFSSRFLACFLLRLQDIGVELLVDKTCATEFVQSIFLGPGVRGTRGKGMYGREGGKQSKTVSNHSHGGVALLAVAACSISADRRASVISRNIRRAITSFRLAVHGSDEPWGQRCAGHGNPRQREWHCGLSPGPQHGVRVRLLRRVPGRTASGFSTATPTMLIKHV